MARPTKYNEERAEAILTALKNGASRRAASNNAGISEDTLARWVASIAGFADALAQAEAAAEIRMSTFVFDNIERDVVKTKIKTIPTKGGGTVTVKEVSKHREIDAGLAKFWLARRRSADWGASREDLSGADGTGAELDKLISGIARKVGSRPLPEEEAGTDAEE